MNNEIQRLHFEIKRINQRLENTADRLRALELLKAKLEKKPEPAPEPEKVQP